MKISSIVCASMLLFVWGCVTSKNLNLVKVGQTREQVTEVLGKPHVVAAIGDTEYLTYFLDHEGSDGKAEYTVKLAKGQVQSFGSKALVNSDIPPEERVQVEKMQIDQKNQAGKSVKGRDGTRAYFVMIEASHPDVRIEAENEEVGAAPLTLRIFGDEDGTFHNFGSGEFVVRAIPKETNLFPQVKVFRTGGWFAQEDKIPNRIFFDMRFPSGPYTPTRY